MDIEKIAAKLRPMMPEKINHWMKTRQLADPELKSLIEKQIISTAYQVFGDFGSKILLSLPPERIAKGPIELGTVLYDNEKWPFGISKSELLQNLGIYGRSGSGKSNLVYHIILQLDRSNIPFLFFDHKRNLRDLLGRLKNKTNIYTPGRSLSKFNFNPFITPPGLETAVFINQLIDIMAKAFTLGEGSKSIIQKAIFTCYEQGNNSPVVQDIIDQVENIQSAERIRGWKISAVRALESLNFSSITSDKVSQQEMVQNLLHENTVIELDGLGSSAKTFLISVIYQWIFQVKLCTSEREKLTAAVIIDEAHHVFGLQSGRGSETLMERLLRMTRELGICNIILDQTPNLISKVVLANCYTNVFLNLASAADQAMAAMVCLLDSEDKKYFSRLPVGQGIVKLQDRWTNPFHMQFPLVDVNKGAVTDQVLKTYFAEIPSRTTLSPRKRSVLAKFDAFSRILPDAIPEEALQLLYHIINHPDKGIWQRYQELGFGVKKGNRLKEQLLNAGWIESQSIDIGRTKRVLLRLTDQAKEVLGLKDEIPEYGSLVHSFWQNFYYQLFRGKGYDVQREVLRISGYTDIVASKEGKRIAIEIDTGKSDFLRNIRQNLLAKYDKIIVVATNKKAFEKIENALAKEGLIIPGKIELVLQDKLLYPD